MRRLISLLLLAVATSAVAAPAATARSRETVNHTLARLDARGHYDAAERARWRTDWRAARRAVRWLRGDERRNLRGVIANTRSLAARRLLGARARPAFETLRHNLEWFVERRATAPANGTREGFGTDVVWQFYDGSGWQLQPLGSFGALNALLARKRTDERVRVLADQLLRLGVTRKGFLAFEYLFPWGGGRPGWISGMAQATGMQAFAGASQRLGDPRLLQAAGRMRPAFERSPPWGVRLRTGSGRAHFLLYSQSPRLLVGNGFAQALLGLDRYRELSGDPRAARLVELGLAQARRNLPRFDTGAWSLYYRTPSGPGIESDLHYHRVFTGFLGRLCTRFDEARFCRMRDHFVAYEAEPVSVTRLRVRKRRHRLDVTLRVSKRSTLTVTVRAGDRVVARSVRALLRGPERFVFARPRSHKPISVTAGATSLTGVTSAASTE
jgi:D-glucuronyl C5-epimerase C-terminus